MAVIDQLPTPSADRIALRVKPAAERAIRQGHPWLYEEAIRRQNREGKPGDLAVIFDGRNRFLAIGLYDPEAPIRVRVLQRGRPATIDQAWYGRKLAAAAEVRSAILNQQTTACRLVHGENDGLPGMVIDRYGNSLVLKIYTLSWAPHLRDLLPAVERLFAAERLLLRLSRAIQGEADQYGLADGQLLAGAALSVPVSFRENGLEFEADLRHGQKTGFFLDQRDNRARAERMAASLPSPGRVLNVFAYTGAFSVYVARGGAGSIWSVDASRPALDQAKRHFDLNRQWRGVTAAEHEIIAGDAFQVMDDLKRQGASFDLVIVDPPSLAGQEQGVKRALKAYERLATRAISLVRPAGRVIMASCTARVEASDFYGVVKRAAAGMGRPLLEVSYYGHPDDHPVTFAQGAYLKCLFATVA